MILKKLGRYELLRVLGKGAMGVVYEGRDPNLDRRVAIKTVKVENLSEEAAAEYEHRFRTEARSAARLQHPNIVSVYDSDRDVDVAFLVMEYIQGDDLKHHLDRGVRYTLEQSLKIIRDLLSALDYAHKQGIVHRDIKPANLLMEPGGRVKLTDFGVARIQDSGEATRTQGSMVGTLKYMAPEQVQGQKIDARADLFSVGVVLYQLLTDKRPFDGDNDFSIIHQIIGNEPPPPSSVNARLPSAIDAVVARALAKDRDQRFATARDFAVALQAAIRRAEDQTVVPPLNPAKRVEPVASRPLTVPGTLPPGTAPGNLTTPGGSTNTSVTQELELVYWKDVKDSADAEDLHGFLDKFPTGIYADLARRRLRKLASGGEATNVGTQPGMGTSTMFPDYESTRVRDGLRPLTSPGEGAAANLRPSDWVGQEYTRGPGGDYTKTLTQSRDGTLAGAPAGAAAATAAAAAATASATGEPVSAAPIPPPAASPVPPAADPPPLAPDAEAPARKKPPVAVLAGIGAVAAIGLVLAMVMGRGDKPPAADVAQPSTSSPAPVARATARPPPAPADVPAVPVAVAAPPPPVVVAAATPAASPASFAAAGKSGASQSRRAASQAARAPKAVGTPPDVAPEPPRAVAAAPVRVEPEPPPSRPLPPPVVAGNSGAAAAVEQCRDRMFLSRELCLAEHCDKGGARNHPLCVKRREEIRLREDSKVRQGPQ